MPLAWPGTTLSFDTSLLEARLLVGHKPLFDDLMRKFQWNVVRGRLHTILSSSLPKETKNKLPMVPPTRNFEPDVNALPVV